MNRLRARCGFSRNPTRSATRRAIISSSTSQIPDNRWVSPSSPYLSVSTTTQCANTCPCSEDAGLIVEEIEQRSRPGRPRLLYRLNPDIRGTWGTDGPYKLLATLLSEVVRTQACPREVGRAAGRHRARHASGCHNGILGVIEEDMVVAGFHPVVIAHPRGCDFVLGRCPFVDVAEKDPPTAPRPGRGCRHGAQRGCGRRPGGQNPRRVGCRMQVRLAMGAEQTSS
jgi:hypothetical protein